MIKGLTQETSSMEYLYIVCVIFFNFFHQYTIVFRVVFSSSFIPGYFIHFVQLETGLCSLTFLLVHCLYIGMQQICVYWFCILQLCCIWFLWLIVFWCSLYVVLCHLQMVSFTSFPIWCLLSLSCLIAVANTSSTMLYLVEMLWKINNLSLLH